MSNTLKIPKEEFLARLNEKRRDYEASIAREEVAREKFHKLEAKYLLDALKLAVKDPESWNGNINWGGEAVINIKTGKSAPKFKFDEVRMSQWDYQELCNVINLVTLSEGDHVPATIHKNAMRFL